MSSYATILIKFKEYRSSARGLNYKIIDLVDDHWRNGYSAMFLNLRSSMETSRIDEFLEIADALATPTHNVGSLT